MKKLPKQKQPEMIRLDYLAALTPFVKKMTGEVENKLIPQLERILAATERKDSQEEIDDAKAKAKKIIDDIASSFVGRISNRALTDIVREFGDRTAKYQADQLANQAKVIGVDLKKIGRTEKGVQKHLDGWAALNASLIKSLPDRYFDDVKNSVYQAIEAGIRHEDLAKHLRDRYEIPLSQAKLIARDQVGKLYGDLNGIRQGNLGITGYIWRTAGDNRVRPEHEAREGDSFEWDSPPSGGHPGEEIQCRCYAEPDFKNILA